LKFNLDYNKKTDKKRSWEETTPSSRRGGDDRIRTPKYRLKDTPSRSGWEDDEALRKASGKWEIPTPKSKHGDYSKKYETPLPTPSYRNNKWAEERKTKKTGSDGNTSSDDEEWNDEQKVPYD
jgi:hypothetical protein